MGQRPGLPLSTPHVLSDSSGTFQGESRRTSVWAEELTTVWRGARDEGRPTAREGTPGTPVAGPTASWVPQVLLLPFWLSHQNCPANYRGTGDESSLPAASLPPAPQSRGSLPPPLGRALCSPLPGDAGRGQPSMCPSPSPVGSEEWGQSHVTAGRPAGALWEEAVTVFVSCGGSKELPQTQRPGDRRGSPSDSQVGLPAGREPSRGLCSCSRPHLLGPLPTCGHMGPPSS